MSTIASIWFEEILKLEVDQAILLRVNNKKEQVKLCNEIEAERVRLSKVDPVIASQLYTKKTLIDAKQYVVVERKFRTPYTAFLKDAQGVVSKISIDPERSRMIKLMIKDKKPRSEVEETLNGLTDEEIEKYYPEI